jgi:hydroxypyruvate reductase
LILSDVVGNPLEFIGSGPTVSVAPEAGAADSALVQAAGILGRYDIATQLGRERWQRLVNALRQTRFAAATAEHTVRNFIIGDVRQAAVAAQVRAMQLGFVSHLLTSHLEGEAREVGRLAAAIARDMSPGHCLILGGETTVTMRGNGMGGRNQELALSAAIRLAGNHPVPVRHRVVASFGTDGEDGPTPAAGAVVNGQTAALGRQFGLDPQRFLDNNDSFHFFQQLDQQIGGAEEQGSGVGYNVGSGEGIKRNIASHHIITGPTGTNVNDLLLILSYEV